MNEGMIVRFRMCKTKNTNIRRQGYITMQMLEEVFGEGSMPSKFPEEALDFKGNQRVPNDSLMERRLRGRS